MAMLRERAAAGDDTPTALLYSSRTLDDVIYREEIDALATAKDGVLTFQTLTRSQPPAWTGYARRIDREMLSEVLSRVGAQPLAYICGPTLLVEATANGLVELGVPAARIRTERFGPTT
jgi:ferredoxin-NADP reductase